jgi:hypothetical protein
MFVVPRNELLEIISAFTDGLESMMLGFTTPESPPNKIMVGAYNSSVMKPGAF